MFRRCTTVKALAALILASASIGAVSRAHADSFQITYLAPGVQTPTGITSHYETFTAANPVGGQLTTHFNGSSVTGTYTGGFQVYGANEYVAQAVRDIIWKSSV